MREKIKGFFEGISKGVAQFYNNLPASIRVYIYSASSLAIATFLGLLSRDILALDVSNEYLVIFVGFVTGLINIVQKEVTDAGTKKLAAENDPKTIEKLDAKIADAKELKKLAK